MPIHHLDVPDRSHFDFVFDPVFRLAALPFGITPGSTGVELAGRRLHVRFGPWRLTTTVDNVVHVGATGPYAWPKVIGPPHLSAADGGITFATNARAGVCLQLRDPVKGIEPIGLIRHGGVTLTVASPQQLIDALGQATDGVDELLQAETDDLEARSAKELRALASERGLEKVSSLKKAELVERLLATDGS